jgi:cysteinyl-tRNA synthetase
MRMRGRVSAPARDVCGRRRYTATKVTIRLHNTLTQRLETFEPFVPGKAQVYVCGLTTYDRAHAGHARTYTTFDVLVRHLRARGFEVTYVRNVTDVDDKILARAKERGEEPLALSSRMSDLCDEQLRAIGCAAPTHEPKVSNNIPEILALIEELIAKGNAYVAPTAKGQDVYFAVRSYEAYGKLSHRHLDDLRAGERVEIGESKKDPLDFALWKGEPEDGWGWPSPWGKGRPGWHIECSAMAKAWLGAHFDIHCGGMDLIFPHHENEIAQSEAAWGAPFARYWLHGGFLNVDKEKMSKSLGNFVTIDDVLARNDAEALRYFLLGTHYRGPLQFDLEKQGDGGRIVFPGVDDAERRVEYLYNTREALALAAGASEPAVGNVLQGQAKVIDEASVKVLSALDKDLNTPQALAVIAELAKAANEVIVQVPKLKSSKAAQDSARQLAARAVQALDGSCAPLGLMQASPEVFASRTRARRLKLRGLDARALDAKVAARVEARAARDFPRADALRKELDALGVDVLDGTDGSTWKVRI